MLWCSWQLNTCFQKQNQKAIHKPSAQHVLDEDYYKRIEAIQFTMSMMMEKEQKTCQNLM